MCAITIYLRREDIQLRKGLLAEKSSRPEVTVHREINAQGPLVGECGRVILNISIIRYVLIAMIRK